MLWISLALVLVASVRFVSKQKGKKPMISSSSPETPPPRGWMGGGRGAGKELLPGKETGVSPASPPGLPRGGGISHETNNARSGGSLVTGDKAFALDASVVLVVSVLICTLSRELFLMSILVPALLILRCILWGSLSPNERGHSYRTEVVLWTVCAVLGAFNDWCSVVVYEVYAYSVPFWLPRLTTIPLWMLCFWGMILRFCVSLARWRRLGSEEHPLDTIRLGRRVLSSARLKIALQLVLVVATRQTIYRCFEDPIWSWAPFAAALVLYGVLFPVKAGVLRLALVFAVGGPVVEILYIGLGGLHEYQLGWLAGVPLWIALWWVLAILIWQDLSHRLVRFLERSRPSSAV